MQPEQSSEERSLVANCVSRDFAIVIRLDIGAKIARPDFRLNHGRALLHLIIVFALVVLVLCGVTARMAFA